MPKRKFVSQPSGTSNKKWKRFTSIVRKRSAKPVRPFTTGQVKALKEVVKQAGGTFTDSRITATLSTTMAAYAGVGGTSFFKLAAGDSEDTREGDSISAQSLNIRGTLRSGSDFDTTVRLMLVQYVNSAGASIDEVLDHHVPLTANYTDPNIVINSFRKLHPEIKYRVLANKTITLKAGANATPLTVRDFRISHKFTKAQASMNYEDGTSAGPKTNSVWLYACYAKQSSSHVAPDIEYQVRGKFIR